MVSSMHDRQLPDEVARVGASGTRRPCRRTWARFMRCPHNTLPRRSSQEQEHGWTEHGVAAENCDDLVGVVPRTWAAPWDLDGVGPSDQEGDGNDGHGAGSCPS
jgi:hypothetical protein